MVPVDIIALSSLLSSESSPSWQLQHKSHTIFYAHPSCIVWLYLGFIVLLAVRCSSGPSRWPGQSRWIFHRLALCQSQALRLWAYITLLDRVYNGLRGDGHHEHENCPNSGIYMQWRVKASTFDQQDMFCSAGLDVNLLSPYGSRLLPLWFTPNSMIHAISLF